MQKHEAINPYLGILLNLLISCKMSSKYFFYLKIYIFRAWLLHELLREPPGLLHHVQEVQARVRQRVHMHLDLHGVIVRNRSR